jgi:hypothetical protein
MLQCGCQTYSLHQGRSDERNGNAFANSPEGLLIQRIMLLESVKSVALEAFLYPMENIEYVMLLWSERVFTSLE